MKVTVHVLRAIFFVVAIQGVAVVEAAPFVTSRNSTLAVPGATVASAGHGGATNLVGTNVQLSAVSPVTWQEGRASLITSERWVRRYGAGTTSFENTPLGIVVRADGSVVVTGYSYQFGTSYDFATICYSSDGTPLWTNRYDGPDHLADNARLIAANAGGHVWVAGESARTVTNGGLSKVAIIKYASNGVPIWTNRHSGFETNSAYPHGLTVDNLGNAYLLWRESHRGSSGVGSLVGDFITKFDSFGDIVWSKPYLRTALDSGQGLHGPVSMALDSTGSLLVAGRAGSQNRDQGTSIVKFNGDGIAMWTNYHSFGFMSPGWILLDRYENAIVSGVRFENENNAYVLMKCSPGGASLWTNVLAGPAYSGGNVPQTVIDPRGNVFLVGGSPGSSPGRYRILKISHGGIPLWTNQHADFGVTNSMIQGAAVDNAGNLYLTGHAPSQSGGPRDYVTIKSPATGHRFGRIALMGQQNWRTFPSL